LLPPFFVGPLVPRCSWRLLAVLLLAVLLLDAPFFADAARPPALVAVPLLAEAAFARVPVFALPELLVPELLLLLRRLPVELEPSLLLESSELDVPRFNRRLTASVAAVTIAAPILLAPSAAASAPSTASRLACLAPSRTFWFAVSAAAAVTRPAASMLRATGF
jgi:hypothetical protein